MLKYAKRFLLDKQHIFLCLDKKGAELHQIQVNENKAVYTTSAVVYVGQGQGRFRRDIREEEEEEVWGNVMRRCVVSSGRNPACL